MFLMIGINKFTWINIQVKFQVKMLALWWFIRYVCKYSCVYLNSYIFMTIFITVGYNDIYNGANFNDIFWRALKNYININIKLFQKRKFVLSKRNMHGIFGETIYIYRRYIHIYISRSSTTYLYMYLIHIQRLNLYTARM